MQVRGEQAESMVYYVDKIQDLENEIGRLRSLRSSDKLKNVKDENIDEDNEKEEGENPEELEESKDSNEQPEEGQYFKGKKLGERVYAAVCQEKEDLDEVILTRTKLDKGIQVCVEADTTGEAAPPKTVSKGIQVGDSSQPSQDASKAPLSKGPPPPPSHDVWATDQYRSRHSKYEESSRPKHPGWNKATYSNIHSLSVK